MKRVTGLSTLIILWVPAALVWSGVCVAFRPALRCFQPAHSLGNALHRNSRYHQCDPLCWPTRSKRSLSSKEESEKDNEPLTPDRVAALIERSFVEACMQLAKGYVDILKLFIVSTKAGYELLLGPTSLIQKVDSCENRSAGRLLMDEEIQLRRNWIHAIYLTLAHLDWKKVDASSWEADAHISKQYQPLLPELVELKATGKAFEAENILENHPELVKEGSAIDRAVVSQTLRVIWITMDVLQEEELAKPRSPRPQIPGAFD
jgi:hypothetical protein